MSLIDKASLIQIPSGYKNEKLYSVKPNPTFGSELVTNGDFATDSDWTIESTWTISGGAANGNGANGSTQELKQTYVNTIGKIYKATFEVLNYVSGTVGFWQGSGISVIPRSANGTYTEYFTATSTEIRFRGTNFYGSIDNVSVKEVFQVNIPRVDYLNNSNGSLILEPQRTNLITYSDSFDNAWWLKLNNVTVSGTKVTSPDGTLNASQLIFDGTTGGRIEKAITGLTSGADYSVSIYARVSSGTQVVSFGSVNVESFTLTTEWQRLTRTEAENDTVGYPRFICDDAATIEVWGFQLEQGSYLTSLIPTTGTTATRLADACTDGGDASRFNDSEGVLFFEGSALNDDGTNRFMSLSDGSNDNRIMFGYRAITNQLFVRLEANNTASVDLTHTLTDSTTNIKFAVLYDNSYNYKLYLNGSLVDSDTGTDAFVGLDTLDFTNPSATENFYGKVKQIQYYNTALTDSELATLTT